MKKSKPVCFETCLPEVTLDSFTGACGLSSLLFCYVHICISFGSCSSNTQTFTNGFAVTADCIYSKACRQKKRGCQSLTKTRTVT